MCGTNQEPQQDQPLIIFWMRSCVLGVLISKICFRTFHASFSVAVIRITISINFSLLQSNVECSNYCICQASFIDTPSHNRLIWFDQVFQRIDVLSKDFDNIVELELGAPWPLPPAELTATLAHKFELIGWFCVFT